MSQQKGQALQDPFLNVLRKEHVPVSIFLVNGIKLQGQIDYHRRLVTGDAKGVGAVDFAPLAG